MFRLKKNSVEGISQTKLISKQKWIEVLLLTLHAFPISATL